VLCVLAACNAQPLSREPTGRVIDVTEFDVVVNVRVSDVLAVRVPMQADEWQVSFDGAILAAVGSPDDLRHPGREGWRLRAIAPGDTALTVTPAVRGGANPPRFTLTVHSES
jgi:hypothetical protein